ncbi:MAG: beta-Ala-His dipeptidase [Paludibacteraceae bacterium]|nr:beta-Ala-His dipeptidase [Paludibacteraceae bacterium]
MAKSFYDFFNDLNHIPRPSHHEGKVADYLCRFAEEQGLKYRRDAENCVVIEKPASPGCENADPVVILNHMDMVCVAKDGYLRDGRPFDPLNDEIRPYVEKDANGVRWMKAEGTSLGADNGMGLSMALAILADDTLVHPALEVLTTTNEEDGMSGAEALSKEFIRGRKVVNLDSEAYDEITVGAAGACLQVGKWNLQFATIPTGYVGRRIVIEGGLGGHSGVDINKGRCNANKVLTTLFTESFTNNDELLVCSLNGGTANASIASWAEMVVAMPDGRCQELDYAINKRWSELLEERFHETDPHIRLRIEEAEAKEYIVGFCRQLRTIAHLPYGVQAMREDMPGTVMTSNNIGVIKMEGDTMTVSCHTRSFDMEEQRRLSQDIHDMMLDGGAKEVERLMDTGSWVERADSPLLALTCETFRDVLGFEPKKVAMHFVLEAAYYVEKYPGIEMASIGPRIIEPHSTSERVDLDTADNIWRVTVELLKRLSK